MKYVDGTGTIFPDHQFSHSYVTCELPVLKLSLFTLAVSPHDSNTLKHKRPTTLHMHEFQV